MRNEAELNWAQAGADMATAETLRETGIYYASVFFSQQAGEKALRTASIEDLRKNPKGHNLIGMANALNAPVDVMNAAAELNAEFLNTRSPESAEGMPFQLYDSHSASLHLESARIIFNWVKETFLHLN